MRLYLQTHVQKSTCRQWSLSREKVQDGVGDGVGINEEDLLHQPARFGFRFVEAEYSKSKARK